MSEFKGTKDIWYVYKPENIGSVNVSFGYPNGFNGYMVLWYHHFDNGSIEAKANALLISKAPEMLQNLIDIVWLIKMGATIEELNDRINTSKQLIKEATQL